MSNFANKLFETLGNLLGDVELSMFKVMHNLGVREIIVWNKDQSYVVKTGPSPETNQVRAVFVNGTPVLQSNVHDALNALEALENYILD